MSVRCGEDKDSDANQSGRGVSCQDYASSHVSAPEHCSAAGSGFQGFSATDQVDIHILTFNAYAKTRVDKFGHFICFNGLEANL